MLFRKNRGSSALDPKTSDNAFDQISCRRLNLSGRYAFIVIASENSVLSVINCSILSWIASFFGKTSLYDSFASDTITTSNSARLTTLCHPPFGLDASPGANL